MGASKNPERRRLWLGWMALSVSTVIASLWAFWGAMESFHEGWWLPTLGGRLLQTGAYLIPMAICLIILAVAVRWPWTGGMVFMLLGAGFTFFIFRERWGNLTWEVVISWLPVTVLVVFVGVVWWFGRPRPMKLAYLIGIGLPLLVAFISAIEPAWRVAHRVDDGITTERLVEGNGVTLVWAPAGPGWVTDAGHCADWYEAQEICRYLSEDGLTVCDEPQDIWRLPTVAEAVASLTRGGENAGGVWDAEKKRATYKVMPDKESPLWKVYAETIYWWTSTEVDGKKAYKVVFNGQVWPATKDHAPGYMGFRAVKEPDDQAN